MRTHKEDLQKELQRHGDVGRSNSITGQLELELHAIQAQE